MDDNGRWRAIRVRAIRVELRSTEVDPNGSNDLSNLLSGSNVRSVPFDDDSSGDGLRPAIRSVPIDEPKLLSVRIPDELQSATMVPTGTYVQILRHRNRLIPDRRRCKNLGSCYVVISHAVRPLVVGRRVPPETAQNGIRKAPVVSLLKNDIPLLVCVDREGEGPQMSRN